MNDQDVHFKKFKKVLTNMHVNLPFTNEDMSTLSKRYFISLVENLNVWLFLSSRINNSISLRIWWLLIKWCFSVC